MSGANALTGVTGGVRKTLFAGVFLLLGGLGGQSWSLALTGLALVAVTLWINRSRTEKAAELAKPWPWPSDFRAQAEAMARPIDPTPKRALPPDEKSSIIAHVATTDPELSRLLADKPPAWQWAAFASVLLQRRNAVGARLRGVVSGYQPRPGVPLSGQTYTQTAHSAMAALHDLAIQLEQFMLSPGFKGAFGDAATGVDADPDGVVSNANRLMDYHAAFLAQAETCLQTPVQPDAVVFVQDVGALTLCPLLGYEEFIATMCARVGEAQDLLPYTAGLPHADGGTPVVQLDNVELGVEIPDGLMDRISAQIQRFNP